MAIQHNFPYRTYMTQQNSGDRKDDSTEITIPSNNLPAEQFLPLATAFRRRLLTGIGSASLVFVGANFAGTTSFLLGLSPETGRNLKLDVIYPIKGFSRCIKPEEGFEFIYPANWVGDQTLLYRAAGKAELERSLDLPLLNRRRNVNEPVVAFGPPGSSGELNVSVVVSPVPLDFSIEAFGGPEEVGEAIVQKIIGSVKRSDVKGTLIRSKLREDEVKEVKYYVLEFAVKSASFRRHNVAVCGARGGRLFTLNAQTPESGWTILKPDFYKIADSFSLTF
ncbi:psbP domain-containing protein 7, chloroplastic [Cynara cardunculus var. scolymus]|uniref:psbP domain-containing protein 7, chloroplastic n=1 Tax=Cynara cardunculus var. scolymus TaxID=59895 RepID=UPI000D6249CF|nr:psbP domain-containing protein 7, chloroplastic [Cynara cardunculus var. scolymus]